MTVEQQTLQWLTGEWIDEVRSYYEVQVDSDCSCSVKTIRADGRVMFTEGLIQLHGEDIYWTSYRLEYVKASTDCIKWISSRLKRATSRRVSLRDEVLGRRATTAISANDFAGRLLPRISHKY